MNKSRRIYRPTLTLSLLLILSMTSNVTHAIVNMDNLHFKQHEDKFSGSIKFQASTSSGNSESNNVSFSNQLQWNTPTHINLLVMGYEYGETNRERSRNNSFIHYRHVRKFSESLDYEFYTQLEENEFTRLTYRGLFGTGLRLSIADSDSHSAYLGIGGFREVEKIDSQNDKQESVTRTGRWNIYLMSRYKLAEQIKFSNTLYWQPRMADSSDRRALFISLLSIKTTRKFSVQFSFESAYDSEPPTSVEKKDSRIKSGIVYSF